MVLPLPLPVLAAGGAVVGWLVGHTARGSELAGGDAATVAAPTPDATGTDAGSASLDWGQDLSSGGGLLPGASPVTDGGGYDYTDGNYPPVPVPPVPAPAPSSPPVAPPPAAPTGTVYARPSAPAPSGAVGWIIANQKTWRWPAVSGWNGAYPVKLGAGGYLTNNATRYVSATRAGILTASNNQKRSVRRLGHSGSLANTWTNDFLDATVTVYPLSTGSVRV